jgi:protein tyrosine/serine phosphatase
MSTSSAPFDAPGGSESPFRVVPTKAIHNFRDYGGYRAKEGRIAWQKLYRSADHSLATQADLDLVANLGLTSVIDLRGASERAKAPCRRPLGFSASVICSEGETTPAPHASAAATAFDADSARRNMMERYGDVAFRPYLATVYRRYFAALATSDGPTLVYCSAGKDRTGVLVALLQSLLGVHRDDIFADYLLTNTVGDPALRLATLRIDLERRFGAPMSEDAVRIVSSVFPEFLQRSFEVITERCGSIDRYLTDVLGVTPELRHAVSARLIVPD